MKAFKIVCWSIIGVLLVVVIICFVNGVFQKIDYRKNQQKTATEIIDLIKKDMVGADEFKIMRDIGIRNEGDYYTKSFLLIHKNNQTICYSYNELKVVTIDKCGVSHTPVKFMRICKKGLVGWFNIKKDHNIWKNLILKEIKNAHVNALDEHAYVSLGTTHISPSTTHWWNEKGLEVCFYYRDSSPYDVLADMFGCCIFFVKDNMFQFRKYPDNDSNLFISSWEHKRDIYNESLNVGDFWENSYGWCVIQK